MSFLFKTPQLQNWVFPTNAKTWQSFVLVCNGNAATVKPAVFFMIIHVFGKPEYLEKTMFTEINKLFQWHNCLLWEKKPLCLVCWWTFWKCLGNTRFSPEQPINPVITVSVLLLIKQKTLHHLQYHLTLFSM